MQNNPKGQHRTLLTSNFRRCDRCRKDVPVGHKSEARYFNWRTSERIVRAGQAKRYNEEEHLRERKRRQRAERIEVLKAKGPLTGAVANERAALLVACVDGRVAHLAEYIRESLDGHNSTAPADGAQGQEWGCTRSKVFALSKVLIVSVIRSVEYQDKKCVRLFEFLATGPTLIDLAPT